MGKYWVSQIFDPVWGMAMGPGEISVHSIETCDGKPCCIHRPSNHHMRQWPQAWRAGRGIMERTCPHGVGHPDPDEYRILIGLDFGVHGCDGCCERPNLLAEGAAQDDIS